MQKEPIAIIGIGCRLPGASTPQEFWQLLCKGVDAITEVPPSRWSLDEYYDPDPSQPRKMNTRWGGFLDQVDQFDPQFFGIAPREMLSMDPQQRLLLETTWEAMEDAGQIPKQLSGSKTAVFIGISSHDYSSLALSDDPYGLTGNTNCIAANRLSYLFNFKGPSLAVDTACSSSLVAVHLACQSLWSGESTLAFAGGVQVLLSADLTVSFSKAGLLAPNGQCKTFDAQADGYVRSEGAGVVLLKPLAQAEQDGDPIYAVIRGSAVNQDGRSNGLSAPNPEAQEAVLREAYRNAGVVPGHVQYVEAHGTGTKIGDPLELKALSAVLGEGRPPGDRCIVGAVKPNVGHSETAAGITGLIKVALALKHQQIPPNLHFHTPNPYIDFETIPLRMPQALEPWPYRPEPALAGVSSFGFGGTNAHIVLQEAPPPAVTAVPSLERSQHLLTLSAKTEGALRELAHRYGQLLQQPMMSLADVCYTANTRRSTFAHRLTIVGAARAAVQAQLVAFGDGQVDLPGLTVGQVTGKMAPRIAFLFTGQGSQYEGMGRELYDTQPTFRRILDQCDALLRPYLQPSLLTVLFAEPGEKGLLHETVYTQPALFALEYALAQLWMSWGVTPVVMLGHSVGEYVAACLAGVFSLEDGLKLIATRGRLMQALPQTGAMVAVLAEEAQVRPRLESYGETVVIAALNSPSQIVLSGQREAIAHITADLEAAGIKTTPLTVSHAFHSPLMEPMVAEFAQVASEVTYRRPQMSLLSNLTGGLIGAEIATPEYWCLHVRQPVKFAASMQTLSKGNVIFLEIGPKPVLLGMGRACLGEGDYQWLPSLRPGQSDWQMLLQSLSALYRAGVEIDWTGFDQDYPRRLVTLPTYPFQRQRYWWSAEDSEAKFRQAAQHLSAQPVMGSHPLLGQRHREPDTQTISFEVALGTPAAAYLQDHRILDEPVLPATAYLELAIAAGEAAMDAVSLSLAAVVIEQPVVLSPGRLALQIQLTPRPGSTSLSFQLVSGTDSSTRHATGLLSPTAAVAAPASLTLAAVQAACPQAIPVAEYYQQLGDRGLNYGTAFQGIQQLWRGEGQALGHVQLPPAAVPTQNSGAYLLHPALMDACFQVLGAAVEAPLQDTYLPTGLTHLQRHCATVPTEVWSHAQLRRTQERSLEVDITLWDSQGSPVVTLQGLTLRAVPRPMLRRVLRPEGELERLRYHITWHPMPIPSNPAPPSPQCWLLLVDSQGIGDQVAARLQTRGDRCIRVAIGSEFADLGEDRYCLNPSTPEAFQSLLQTVALPGQSPLAGILHFWSLAEPAPLSTEALHHTQQQSCGSALALVQALAQTKGVTERLWLFTQGAQAVEAQPVLRVEQTPLWGLGRTIALEHPELNCVRVDLDATPTPEDWAALEIDLTAPAGEDQIVYRQGKRFGARLERLSAVLSSTLQRPRESPFQLKMTEAGILDNLTLSPCTRRPPAVGEVEIQVVAAGLNFRDVLNALGMLQAYLAQMGVTDAAAIPFGGECSGWVTAVGEGVTGLQVGDAVIAANAIGSLASFVTAPAVFVVPKPEVLSFSEAATVATTFLTAAYGLHHLAQIQPGDRVLIHAAAGGVGQAAVQLAQNAGADVFATASPSKWEALQAMGVQHTFNSRTLDFAEEIRECTGGQGVTLVLNSLNGDFIAKNLDVLAPGGRFVEIGKLGIWEPEQVAAVRPDVGYYPFDLLEVSQQQPTRIASLLQDLMAAFREGTLKPLPHRVFPIDEAPNAFRFMAQAKHVGKVVLDLTVSAALPRVCGNASYLITGGLGALGLQVAQWLVEQGAAHLVLMGRREPSEAAQRAIALLQQQGVQVKTVAADIAQPAAVQSLMDSIAQDGPPLRGIIHAAGVLEDGVLTRQSWAQFERVMAPKVAGAWNLHQATQTLPLDFFVTFSSIAALLGSPGQGNYAAANAFLDGLAHYRRSLGLPGLSINWGTWSGRGMAAALSERDAARLSLSGITPLTPNQGLQTLEALLSGNASQVGVFDLDWSKFVQQLPKGSSPFLSALAAAPAAKTPSAFLTTLTAAPAEDRYNQLSTHVRSQIAKVLGVPSSDDIDPSQGFSELGMDSLMGMELKSRLQSSLDLTLPITLAADYPTVGAMIDYLAGEVLAPSPAAPRPTATPVAAGEGASNGNGRPHAFPASRGAGLSALDFVLQSLTSLETLDEPAPPNLPSPGLQPVDLSIPPEFYQFERSPQYQNLKQYLEQGQRIGNPFMTVHDGIAGDTTSIAGQTLINFASYNYLGLSGHPAVSQAAKDAIDRYGTSVSASRVVSGERPIHQALEQAIAQFLGTDDCLAYIGGHTTNVSTIGHLFGKNDLILCDAYSHNSIQIGCDLSGATVFPFAHNDVGALEQHLQTHRPNFEKVLIVVEGVYSTDGDLAPLPSILALKERYKAFLMVDEAHSMGVIGQRGRGIAEHFNLNPQAVDLWMGTLSKSLASCGGYIAGSNAMVEYLRYTSPGFVFSVGMTPPNAASALAALQILQAEPERVAQLRERTHLFLTLAQAQGLDTGTSHDSPIVPVIIGDPYRAVQISQRLGQQGINVQPMIYPSVPYHEARLRFFLSCTHTEEQIRYTVESLAQEMVRLQGQASLNWLHYLMRSHFVTERATQR